MINIMYITDEAELAWITHLHEDEYIIDEIDLNEVTICMKIVDIVMLKEASH